MIGQLAKCPYCRACEIALDDSPELVFHPATCAHLVWVDGRYSQWDPGDHGIVHPVGSIEFHWEHPGLAGADFGDYLKELVNSGKEWPFAPGVPFEIVQMSADDKAKTPRGTTYTAWEVDGQAVFAQEASTFLAA